MWQEHFVATHKRSIHMFKQIMLTSIQVWLLCHEIKLTYSVFSNSWLDKLTPDLNNVRWKISRKLFWIYLKIFMQFTYPHQLRAHQPPLTNPRLWWALSGWCLPMPLQKGRASKVQPQHQLLSRLFVSFLPKTTMFFIN